MKLDDAIGQQNRAWVDIAEANQGLSVFASMEAQRGDDCRESSPVIPVREACARFWKNGDRPEHRAEGGGRMRKWTVLRSVPFFLRAELRAHRGDFDFETPWIFEPTGFSGPRPMREFGLHTHPCGLRPESLRSLHAAYSSPKLRIARHRVT